MMDLQTLANLARQNGGVVPSEYLIQFMGSDAVRLSAPSRDLRLNRENTETYDVTVNGETVTLGFRRIDVRTLAREEGVTFDESTARGRAEQIATANPGDHRLQADGTNRLQSSLRALDTGTNFYNHPTEISTISLSRLTRQLQEAGERMSLQPMQGFPDMYVARVGETELNIRVDPGSLRDLQRSNNITLDPTPRQHVGVRAAAIQAAAAVQQVLDQTGITHPDIDRMEADLRRVTANTGITVERVPADGRPIPPRNFTPLNPPVLETLNQRRDDNLYIGGSPQFDEQRRNGPRPEQDVYRLDRPAQRDEVIDIHRFDRPAPLDTREPDYAVLSPRTGMLVDRDDRTYGDGAIAPRTHDLLDRGEQIVISQLPYFVEPASPTPARAEPAATAAASAPAATADDQAYATMDAIRQRAMSGDAQAQAAIAGLDGDGQFSVKDIMKLQLMGADKMAELQQIAGALNLSGVSAEAPRAATQTAQVDAPVMDAMYRPSTVPDIRTTDEGMLRFT